MHHRSWTERTVTQFRSKRTDPSLALAQHHVRIAALARGGVSSIGAAEVLVSTAVAIVAGGVSSIGATSETRREPPRRWAGPSCDAQQYADF